ARCHTVRRSRCSGAALAARPRGIAPAGEAQAGPRSAWSDAPAHRPCPSVFPLRGGDTMRPRITLTAAAMLAVGALLGYLAPSDSVNPLRSADAAQPPSAGQERNVAGGFAGRVQGAGGPIAGATVTLYSAGDGKPTQLAQGKTGDDGAFTLDVGANKLKENADKV